MNQLRIGTEVRAAVNVMTYLRAHAMKGDT